MTILSLKSAVNLASASKPIETWPKTETLEHSALIASLSTFETGLSRHQLKDSLCSIPGELKHVVGSCGAEDQFPADSATSASAPATNAAH